MKFLAIIILFGIVACNPVKKAIRTMNDNPKDAAKYCAERFPVQDSVIIRDSVSYDTLWGAGDTVRIALPGQYSTIKVPCPPVKTITKVIRRDSIIIRRDLAKETVLRDGIDECYGLLKKTQGQLQEANEKLVAMRKDRSKWRLWFWIACGAVGAYTILRLKRVIGV